MFPSNLRWGQIELQFPNHQRPLHWVCFERHRLHRPYLQIQRIQQTQYLQRRRHLIPLYQLFLLLEQDQNHLLRMLQPIR